MCGVGAADGARVSLRIGPRSPEPPERRQYTTAREGRVRGVARARTTRLDTIAATRLDDATIIAGRGGGFSITTTPDGVTLTFGEAADTANPWDEVFDAPDPKRAS